MRKSFNGLIRIVRHFLNYESWTMPVSVMLSVASASLGALIGMKIWGLSLSIYGQLGLVMLIGLAAKNAILMVEFSKVERESGQTVTDAAPRGADAGFRAVLMTTWSFVLGVLPLVFASGTVVSPLAFQPVLE